MGKSGLSWCLEHLLGCQNIQMHYNTLISLALTQIFQVLQESKKLQFKQISRSSDEEGFCQYFPPILKGRGIEWIWALNMTSKYFKQKVVSRTIAINVPKHQHPLL